MNRQERRALIKKYGKDRLGALRAFRDSQLALAQQRDSFLSEGERVRIKTEAILNHKGAESLRQEYIQFLNDAKDKIFTVEYDPRFTKTPYVVCLKEDPTPVKWLFSVVDLEKVKSDAD